MNLAKLLTGSDVTVASVVWPLVIGAFLAVAIAVINKMAVGRVVKALISAKASSPESAKTLKELGMSEKGYIAYALRPSSTLRSLIGKNEENGGYFIPEDKAFRAENTYVSDRASYVTLIVAAVIFLASGIGLNQLVPKLIDFAIKTFL